jgi:ELWxxDGT repeat protein
VNKRSLPLLITLSGLFFLAGLIVSLAYAGNSQAFYQIGEADSIPASSYPSFLTDVDGTLFFSAHDGVHGQELWMTDGTPAGTKLVADIYPGPEGSYPTDLINVDGMLFFSADDGVHGTELWMSDGTESGTKLFADIDPGSIALEPLEAEFPTEVDQPTVSPQPTVTVQPTVSRVGDSVGRQNYVLKMGNQHLYEEPWGGDRGDPCEAWRTGNFDDTDPNYRGFNLELNLTNKTDQKVSDDWAENLSFFTDKGKELQACYYGYDGMGPAPKGTTSVTFFTVVPKGDFVKVAELDIGGDTLRLCFDGQGSAFQCR